MRITIAVWALLLGVLALAAGAGRGSTDDSKSVFDVRQSDEGVLISEAGKKVLFYQRQPRSIGGEYQRAHYIHPLYGLDGEILTEDFPRDHLHHRGVFWAWHQVQVAGKPIGDSWEAKGFRWDVKEAKPVQLDAGSMALRTVVHWKSPQWVDAKGVEKPFVEETTLIRVHRAAGGIRNVDFEIGLAALEEDVRLGGSEDEKGYGGFSPRFWLPADVRFTGRSGAVKPEVNAVQAGPWVDVSGTFAGGKTSGIAMLAHPSLPVFPPPWILRDRASMQNPVYPGREPKPLVRGKPLVLRYRLVVHRGDAAAAGIDKLQREYEAAPLPKY
jgi:hypothetical protein